MLSFRKSKSFDCDCFLLSEFLYFVLSVYPVYRSEASQMETMINNFIQYENECDMFIFMFMGHGFGKGLEYLYGSDMKVKL